MDNSCIHSKFTLRAIERLKLRKQIETLFRKGEAFSVLGARVIFLVRPLPSSPTGSSPVQIGFSVPKKKIKAATDRNRIKRVLREAWRLQKHALYQAVPEGQQLQCFLIFTGTLPLPYPWAELMVHKAMEKLMAQLAKKR